MTAAPPPSGRWLWGPAADLLLGCGVLYAFVFLVMLTVGPSIRTHQAAFLFPLLILLVSTPHYGATLVRVYEHGSERRSYKLFSTWLSLGILALFIYGIFSPLLASILVTVLFTWSPYHYTGQNYGIAMLFLRRRGVPISSKAQWALWLSFMFSYGLIFIGLNVAGQQPTTTPRGYTATAIEFMSLNIPMWTFGPMLAAYVASLVATAVLFLRAASPRDLAPAAMLILSQGLWFSLPLAVIHWNLPAGEVLSLQYRAYYFIWIGLAHGIQYLWITSYYANASDRWHGVLPYWGKTLLAGTAVWTLPVVVAAPFAMGLTTESQYGTLTYDSGIALLVAACVNIHHFMLDGVIWKLRRLKIASVLIRDESATEPQTPSPTGHNWIRPLVWSFAAAALSIAVFVFWNQSVAYPSSITKQDWQRAGAALDRLAVFGYDSHTQRLRVGQGERAAGRPESSLRHFQVASQMNPRSVEARTSMANVLHELGKIDASIEYYLEALAIQPDFVDAHYNLGNALATRHRYREAVDHFRAVTRLRPDFSSGYTNLGNALLRIGDKEGAIDAYRTAIRMDPGAINARNNLNRALQIQ